jgi:ABC-type dipeptide/oligopeptide/nickel transport system permease subunit
MSLEIDSMADATGMITRTSGFRRFRRVFFGRKIVMFGLIIIVALLITAIFAPLIAPYDPYEQDLTQPLLQPNHAHLLGTDALGRDTLSRVIYGSRVSLIVGISAIIIAGTIGITLGLIAGYFGGLTFTIIMRSMDALMAIPMLALVLVVASMLGGGLKNVVIALSFGAVAMYARMMCGQVLTVRENDYVLAGRAMGATNLRIILRHLLPNCFPPLIVLMTMQMGIMILAEAGLSFLGIGVEPPIAAWGAMVTDGYRYLLTNPMLSFAPGLAVMFVVFTYNMVGDGLRDAIDPRLRGTL